MANTPVAMRASALVDTFAVNAHISWADTVYGNTGLLTQSIDYLGVKNVRDGAPYAGFTLSTYQGLAAKGVKFTIIVDGSRFGSTGNWNEDISNIKALASSNPGSVSGIEGPNEINLYSINYNGSSTGANLALGHEIQQALYTAVKGDAALSQVPVLALTVGGISVQQAGALGDLSSITDWANYHTYFGGGAQPGPGITEGVANAKTLSGAHPVAITETGYYTAVNDMSWGGGGVTEPVQARLTLNLFMDAAKLGVLKTFIYELFDDGTAPPTSIEGAFGLFHNDGSPKEAATGIHNLTTILADQGGGGGATGSLDYTISGLPNGGNTLLTQKSNGAYDLIIWNEPQIWDQGSKSQIPASNTPVTITLGQAAGTVAVYDPLKGSTPVSSAQNTNTIKADVSDHPIVVEIGGAGTPAPGPAPTPTPPTTPNPAPGGGPTTAPTPAPGPAPASGPDTIEIWLSEDAFNGDAQFIVSIDGSAIGGTQTAHSKHGSGTSDFLTAQGSLSPGDHLLTVNFLNDQKGTGPGQDRNLYVDAIHYNGQPVPGGAAPLLTTGIASFTIHDITPI